ncbi:MAG: sugar phosphate isomerase/epimerase [Nanoarchaeota archaeon]|nr:sugar phosphate isomerase/epimerase [Nanoarchaeota archaeon]MBU1004445.1 sugar phosphate isomerase/epimerase [Nanoarchaeota archaeon]MBU1946668.1 sugar phosphate isomerase/epimerase [Nanoarchaeota archaeon]
MKNETPDMRISALTACGPTLTLEDWMKEAKRIGLDGLEVAAFQRENVGDVASGARKDYVADTLSLAEPLSPARATEIIAMGRDLGVTITHLGSYDNHLHQVAGEKSRPHLKKVIDAAYLLRDVMPAGPLVATFVGADPNLRMQENYERFKQQFLPLVAYAQEKGVRIMIENCPMEGWEASDRPVNNLMSSPSLWYACFKAADAAGVGKSFGLEYDPSHRIWQTAGRMDLVARDIAEFGCQGRIYSIHGKGAKHDDEGLWMDGIDGRLVDLPHEWAKRSNYEHAVPGAPYDSVNWKTVISLARALGVPFVTLEIEDPNFKDMKDPAKSGELGIKAIELGRTHLMPLCYANGATYQAPSPKGG